MPDFKELKRIYRIEAPGLDEITSKLHQLSHELELQKAIKKEASKILLTNKDDAEQIVKQTKIIADSEIAIKKLSAEKRIASKEAAALISAVEKLAKAQIDQDNATQHANKSINEAAANYKALYALAKAAPGGGLINWKGEQIGIDQATVELRKYRTVVDDFNRSLSPDGTLVGEYSKGILNAFKDLGLDKLIEDQKFKIQQEISDLIVKNQTLVKHYKDVGRSGPEAFRAIEPELERNISRQRELESQLLTINSTLGKTGQIGAQVTSAIGRGFRDIISAGLGVAGVTLGFQQVFQFLNQSNAEFKQAELNSLRLRNALKNLGQERYFDELNEQASTLAKNIGYLDNDDIIKAQEKLVTYGKLTKAQIKELIPTIIELAANLGIGLEESTGIVIKGLEGGGRALKEYGIKVKDSNTLLENFNIIQTQLKQRVDGSSKSMLALSGSTAVTDQQVKDFQEEIGAKSGPALAKFKANLLGGINALLDFQSRIITANSFTRSFFRLLGSEDVKKYDFEHSALGVYTGAVKETMTQLPKALDDLNQLTKDKQQAFVNAQENYIQGARLTYLQLKDSGTASEEELKRAAGVLDGYKKIKAELQKQLSGDDKAAFTDAGDPDKIKKAADEAERLRKELLEKRLKNIDSAEFQAQFILEKRRAEGKVLEGEYESALYEIHKKAQDARIKLLSAGNEDEKSKAAKLRVDELKEEQDYSGKVFEIIKKRITNEIEARRIAARDQASAVVDDPGASPKKQAEAQLKLNQDLETIQADFNRSMDDLETNFRKKSEENARERGEALKAIDRQVAQDRFDVQKETFTEQINQIQTDESDELTALAVNLQGRITEILKSSRTARQKERDLNSVRRDAAVTATDVEIAAQQQLVKAYKDAREKNLVTEQEYNDQLKKLSDLRIQKQEAETKKFIDLEKNKEETRQAIITGVENFIDTLLQGVFENQQRRLDKEKELADKRLNLEKEQMQNQAQSQDERDALEKQYAAKKEALDRIAFEKNKQQKIKEIKIEAAVGAAKAIAQNPPPSPVGLIAALFVALQAAAQIAAVNKQTFAEGGRVLPFLRDGRINTAPNVRPLSNGDNVLAYVRPGEVILNARQQALLGGDATFRRLGVPGFALGGRIPGDFLRPPANPSSFLTPSNQNGSGLEAIGQLIAESNAAINARIDRIQVFNDPRAAQKANAKLVKNDKIGSM